jgi:serine/threonine protein phosphatase PrpC
VAAVSDRGRLRETNEDRCLVTEQRGTVLLAVADGVGGESGGEVASEAALDALARSFFSREGDAGAALAAAVREANDAVLRASQDQGHPLAASTIVAAAVRRARAVVANLGDSRAYIVSQGSARQVTADHAGEMPGQITRFVGDPRGVQPDVFIETLRPGERLLLCSDGLTRHLDDQEIAAAAVARPHEAAASLVAAANERGGEDNVSVVVYAAPPRALVSLPALATALVLGLLGLLVASFALGLIPADRPGPAATPHAATPAPATAPPPTPTPTETGPPIPSP